MRAEACDLVRESGRGAWRILGRARVSRAGERVLAIANFPPWINIPRSNRNLRKDCFGATPKPARETRALPNAGVSHRS
jgi:hypothetical protein